MTSRIGYSISITPNVVGCALASELISVATSPTSCVISGVLIGVNAVLFAENLVSLAMSRRQ